VLQAYSYFLHCGRNVRKTTYTMNYSIISPPYLIRRLSTIVFFICTVFASYGQLDTPVTTFPTCGASSVITPIQFAWNPTTGAAFYTIEVSTSSTGWSSNFGFPPGSTLLNDNVLNGATNYLWNGAVLGATYYYTVRAIDQSGFGTSNFSAPCQFSCATTSCSLPVPTGIIAQATSATSVQLSWNSVALVDEYRIYDHGSYIQTIPAGTTTFNHSGLLPGSTHCYTLSSCCNSISCSNVSDPEACAMTNYNTTYTISGKTRKANNDYIAGALVTFTGTYGSANLASVTSYSDGTYIRNDVPPGWSGTITAEKIGYTFETITIQPVYGNMPGTHVIGTIVLTGPNISVTPQLLNFGDVLNGLQSAVQSITLVNSGDQLLQVSSIQMPAGFINTGFNGGDIVVGQSVNLSLSFSPTQVIFYNPILQITSNAVNSPQLNIQLNGTGIQNTSCAFLDTSFNTLIWAYQAATDLCSLGILDDDGYCEPEQEINRAALVKMAFKSIDLHLNTIKDTIVQYPSPFLDLQEETPMNGWYYLFAKNLYYLDFGDGINALDKTSILFEPNDEVSRSRVLKILLETWDVDIDTAVVAPYSDVSLSHDFVNYIHTAKMHGIISSSQSNFRPNDYALRAEVFVILNNLLNHVTIQKPTIAKSDFFEPGNYTPSNFGTFDAMHSGNFSHYAKTSFAIPSIGIPLTYTHIYNSYATEITSDLYPIKPLGFGWSHTYNSYIVEKYWDVQNSPSHMYAVQALPDGGFHVFENQGLNQFEAITEGVYNVLEKPNGATYVLNTKDQMTYVYQKFSGTPASFPYVLTSIKDRNNNILSIQYQLGQNGYYRILKVLGPAGRELQFTYYENSDLIKTITDPLGRVIEYDYSGYNFSYVDQPDMVSFTNASGEETIFSYGTTALDQHLLMTITLPKGNTITNTYEQRKLASTQTNPNTVQQYAYNRNYKQNSLDDFSDVLNTSSDGTQTTINYNHQGKPKHISSDNLEATISYHADQTYLPDTITVNNKSATLEYDSVGNLLMQTGPTGIQEFYEYNNKNDLIKYIDPGSNVYTMDYDFYGNLILSTTPRGSTSYQVKPNGLLKKTINAEGIETSFQYDNYGNINQIQRPLSIISTASYDLVGRVLETVNPNGQKTTFEYDNNDNTQSQSHEGIETGFDYDDNDNLIEIINAKNNSTFLNYDFENDFLDSISFGGFSDIYSYTLEGKLDWMKDPENMVFNYSYYADNGMLRSVSTSIDSIVYVYNADKLLETVSKAGNMISYGYDSLFRVSSIDYNNESIGYTYDESSNLTSIVYPDNLIVQYEYYPDNLLKKVTDWQGKATNYTYLDDGRLATITYPNGTHCSYAYDAASRMISMGWERSNNTIINDYQFVLDPIGNHLKEISTEPYDSVNLSAVNLTASYDAVNRIQQYGTTNYTFNDNGTYQTKGGVSYIWDEYDRLLTVNGMDSIAGEMLNASYTYDPLGHRRSLIHNGKTTNYTLDILGMSRILLERDSVNNPTRYYIYGLGLISSIDANTQDYSYYHYDFRGSTVAITDIYDSITHRYQYGPFGELWQSEEAFYNPFRYVGQHGVMYEYAALYYMRARYYDVESGRFLSEDPVWGTNLYDYARGNPIIKVDFNGAKETQAEYTNRDNRRHYRRNDGWIERSNNLNQQLRDIEGLTDEIDERKKDMEYHKQKPRNTYNQAKTHNKKAKGHLKYSTMRKVNLALIRDLPAKTVSKSTMRTVVKKVPLMTILFITYDLLSGDEEAFENNLIPFYGGRLGGERYEMVDENGNTYYIYD
jgi:RHS repeat-associated protein